MSLFYTFIEINFLLNLRSIVRRCTNRQNFNPVVQGSIYCTSRSLIYPGTVRCVELVGFSTSATINNRRQERTFRSTSADLLKRPLESQWVDSCRRKGERIIMLAIKKWWRYCRYRYYF